jgi:hypothetical protein
MRRPSGSELTTRETTLPAAGCAVGILALLFAAPQRAASADAVALERVPAEPFSYHEMAVSSESRGSREDAPIATPNGASS